MRFLLILIVIMAAGFAAWSWAGLALAVAGLTFGYWVSVRRHPRVRHRGPLSCHGTGERRGLVFTWTHRQCAWCTRGRKIRWGARRWGTQQIRGQARVDAAVRRRARENRASR